MGYDYVKVARDFAKRRGDQSPPPPPPASDADELVVRALAAATKVYEAGAIPWAAEFRPDLIDVVAEIETEIGGAGRWREWTPSKMQELRGLLLRWYGAQKLVSEEYRDWQAAGAGRTA